MDKKFIEDSVKKVFTKEEEEDEVKSTGSSSFAQQIKQQYSFKNMHNKIVSTIMNQIISWILKCFDKYTETQFHTKMAEQYTYQDKLTGAVYPLTGFDFIEDWRINHKDTFDNIIPIMKKLKVPINKHELLGLTINAIQKQGWTVKPHEVQALRLTINRLYHILYHGVDSISIDRN